MAHRTTGELTRSLGLTRPMRVTVDLQDLPSHWRSEFLALPAVTNARMDSMRGGHAAFVLESADLRTTTPALIAWLQQRQMRLISMEAEPVTLTDVFLALSSPREDATHGA